jgi:hypothetical protein
MPNLYKRGETWWARFKVVGSNTDEAYARLLGLTQSAA